MNLIEVLTVKAGSVIPRGCDPAREVFAYYWNGNATILRAGPDEDIDDVIRQVPHVRRMKIKERRKNTFD